jgi:hypothetical protein
MGAKRPSHAGFGHFAIYLWGTPPQLFNKFLGDMRTGLRK